MCGKPVRAEVFGMPPEETSIVALLTPTTKTILCHWTSRDLPATHGFDTSDKPSIYHPDGAESNYSYVDKLRYLFFRCPALITYMLRKDILHILNQVIPKSFVIAAHPLQLSLHRLKLQKLSP